MIHPTSHSKWPVKSGPSEDTPEQDLSAEEQITESEESRVEEFDEFTNIFLAGPVCQATITPIVDYIISANLHNATNPINCINLFIDTDGGDLNTAMKLIDAMEMSEIPIRTIGWGTVASAGLMLFMAGKERFLSRNCSILSHNATFNASLWSVKVTDNSHQRECSLIVQRVTDLYQTYTGKDARYIKKHLLKEVDVYLSAEEALKHNLGDSYLPKGFTWLKTFGENPLQAE